jgi:hypothetical protein
VQTDGTIHNNKPDTIARENEQEACTLCTLRDVAIPGDRRVIEKEAEKVIICKDLIIEIRRMWTINTKVTPVITGATGSI